MRRYYQDDAVTIYHGDSAEMVFLSADRVVTDPPYGTAAYEHDVAPNAGTLARWCEDFKTVAIFGYAERLVRWCMEARVAPDEWVTWWPTNTIGGQRRAAKLPRECEHIAVFGEVLGAARLSRPRSNDSWTRAEAERRGHDTDLCRLGDVWRDPSPGVGFNAHLRQHQNEKPLSLMYRLVELCSDQGDTVLDPYAGSGTTLRAAKDLGRRAIGIEIEERYCEIAAQRCAQEVLEIAEVNEPGNKPLGTPGVPAENTVPVEQSRPGSLTSPAAARPAQRRDSR